MTEISLNINVAGRSYPLTIKKEDEQVVLQAAKLISEKVKEFETTFAIRDRQDLLAMSALNLLVTQLSSSKKSLDNKSEINQLNLFITQYLQNEASTL